MKYAILSDIHANADAFSVVLEKCREVGVEKYISLGDIVGYNAEPVRCIQMAQAVEWAAKVRGNHDDYTISGDTEMSGFNNNAKLAIQWTRDQLDASQRSWLSTLYIDHLPACLSTIVHATLDTPENWGYIIDLFHATANFTYQLTPLCFCGHSHLPVAFDKKPMTEEGSRPVDVMEDWQSNRNNPAADTDFTIADELTVDYVSGHKYLFNIGSIGQPRNGDPRASFAVLDTSRRQVTRYRLPYDIASAQNKIIDAGLPERLALRLEKGI